MPRGSYRLVSLATQLPGASGGYRAHLSGIVKPNSPGAPYCIPNEYVCARVGHLLGLPIPPGGIVYAAGSLPPQNPQPFWFASLDFNLQGDSLPPVDPLTCVTELPDESAGLLLFDILVANSDRHTGNLYVDRSSQPAKMSVFDHSHALFGPNAGQARQRLATLRDRLGVTGGQYTAGNRHCLLDQVRSVQHFEKWEERIRQIPDYLVEGTCFETVGLGVDADEAEAAAEFLKYRRTRLWDLLDASRAEFKAIQQWRLTV